MPMGLGRGDGGEVQGMKISHTSSVQGGGGDQTLVESQKLLKIQACEGCTKSKVMLQPKLGVFH